MAKVPLRLYIRDIENLIDRGQTEEALAHCKHILQTYPKCIDVYRLLGKSYLESQRYTDAADILQRVLATIPDDFVSHVGMSIIREDEGNLDGAIWHMERAYETQPANNAVQDELRRLYGRRDGLEPPRVRMTRGALVRMYVKGDLYQQAIAELQAALSEDPLRDDLQVLLAKMYTQTGRRVEAIEICSRIIAKSPFCFEANRIMTELLPGTSRADDVKTYQQRVATLDPYMALATAGSPVSEIADNAITVERLDWDSSRKETSQPAWANSLGINVEDKNAQFHELPDWLASLTPFAPSGSPEPPPIIFPTDDLSMPAIFASDSAGTNEAPPIPESTPDQPIEVPAAEAPVDEPDNQLPDWMKEAGWGQSDAVIEEQPASTQETGEVDEALPAEIPDWLRSFAPVEVPQEAEAQTSGEEEGSLNGLDEVLAASLMAKGTPASEPAGIEAPGEFDEIPAWLTLTEGQPAETVEAELSAEAQPLQESVPDWLSELNAIAPSEAEPQTPFELQEVKQIPEAPAWAKATMPVLPNEPMPSASEGSVEAKDTYAWLEELANQHGAEAPTIIARRSEREEKPPTWIHSDDELPQPESGIEAEEMEWNVPLPEDHVPELLDAKFPAIPEGEVPGEAEMQAAQAESLEFPELSGEEGSFPDWLISLATASIIPDEETVPSLAATPAVEPIIPDLTVEENLEPLPNEGFVAESQDLPSAWLPVQEIPEEAAPEAEPGQPIFTPEISSAWADEIDKAFSGLEPEEGIQLATSEELPADGSGFDLPDWLKGEIGDQVPADQSLTGETELADEGSILPDWFSEEPQALEPAAAGEEITQSAIDSLVEPEVGEAEPVTAAGEFSGQLFDESEPAGVLPDWLRGLNDSPQETQAEEVTQEEVPADSGLPDWLQSISAEVSASTSTDIFDEEIPLAAEEGVAPEPGFEFEAAVAVTEETQEIQVAGVEPEPVSIPEEEIPEWLAELQLPEPQEAEGEDLVPAVPETIEQPVETLAEAETQVNEQPEAILTEAAIETAAGLAEISTNQLVKEVEPVAEAVPEPAIEQPVLEPEPAIEQPTIEQPVAEAVPTDELPASEELPTAETYDLPAEEPISAEEALLNRLYAAQTSLYGGQVGPALEFYEEVIRSGNLLDESIHDLRDALYRYPVDISVWQLLGDAYLRSNRLQEALDAYTKAEELIR